MYILNSGKGLIGDEEDRLQGELSITEFEHILQGRSEEIQDNITVVFRGSATVDKGDARTASQGIISVGPIVEPMMLDIFRLELDSNHSSAFAIFPGSGIFDIVAIGYVEREEH